MTTTAKTTFTQDEEGRWWIPKDPDAVLDYSLDWSKWLAKVNDSIESLTIVLPEGTELTEESSSFDGAVTSAMVSGGDTADSMQALTFRVVTVGGRTEDRTVYLKITER